MEDHVHHELGFGRRWRRRPARHRDRSERLMAAARHSVLFVGVSAVLTLAWALSDRQTAFWPGWIMVLWAPLVTLQAWSAMRPSRWDRDA